MGLFVGTITEGTMFGVFAIAQPVITGFFNFEANGPGRKLQLNWLIKINIEINSK